MTPESKRKYERLIALAKAYCFQATHPVLNLSMGGVAIRTANDYTEWLDRPFLLNLSFSANETCPEGLDLSLMAMARHSYFDTEHHYYIVGIEFINMTQETKASLASFIQFISKGDTL